MLVTQDVSNVSKCPSGLSANASSSGNSWKFFVGRPTALPSTAGTHGYLQSIDTKRAFKLCIRAEGFKRTCCIHYIRFSCYIISHTIKRVPTCNYSICKELRAKNCLLGSLQGSKGLGQECFSTFQQQLFYKRSSCHPAGRQMRQYFKAQSIQKQL